MSARARSQARYLVGASPSKAVRDELKSTCDELGFAYTSKDSTANIQKKLSRWLDGDAPAAAPTPRRKATPRRTVRMSSGSAPQATPASPPSTPAVILAPATPLRSPPVDLDAPLPPRARPPKASAPRRPAALAPLAAVAAVVVALALALRRGDAPTAPPLAAAPLPELPRSALADAFAEAAGAGPSATSAAEEVRGFGKVWASARAHHAAALVLAGDAPLLAAATAALEAGSGAAALRVAAGDAVAWPAVRAHLASTRRAGKRALVVVDGCEDRHPDDAARAEALVDPLLARPFDLGPPDGVVDLAHAAFVWTLATPCGDLRPPTALDALKAAWTTRAPPGFYNRVQFGAVLCPDDNP